MEEETSDTWTKILEDSKKSGTNYEDAIKGLLLEKLLAVVKHPVDRTVYNEYVKFMKELGVMFEKLRRFPKMISKFIFCIRTDVVTCFEKIDKTKKIPHKPWSQLVLPPQFMASIGPVVSLLPSGQIVDFWKTIHHNLEEECIKKIFEEDDQYGLRHFLSIVVDLLHEFLISIKVADTSVPISQIEQISTLMLKLKNGCLAKLATALLKRKHDSTLIAAFLKLTYTWAELHALMLLYNSKYKNSQAKNEIFTVAAIDLDDLQLSNPVVTEILSTLAESSEAFNLSCIHPYLDPKSWLRLCDAAKESDDAWCKILLVKLVAQKMKYLRVLQGKCSYLKNRKYYEKPKTANDITGVETSVMMEVEGRNEELGLWIAKHLVEAANFLWVEQSEWLTLQELQDVFLLSGECLEPLKMIQLAGNFVRKVEDRMEKGKTLEDDQEVKVEEEEDNVEVEVRRMENGMGTSHNAILPLESEKKHNMIEMETEWVKMNDNPVFCTAVLLDVARVMIRRLAKMKLHKRYMKNLTSDVMCIENLVVLLQNLTNLEKDEESKKKKKKVTATSDDVHDNNEMTKSENILTVFLNHVNELIEDNAKVEVETSKSVKFSEESIKTLLEFLCTLPLADYSQEVKSFMGLFAISMLITVGPYGTNDESESVNNSVAKLVTKCSMNSRGNITLFAVKWPMLFKWVTLHLDYFSLDVTKQILTAILSNIYMSKSCIEDFEPILNLLCDNFKVKGTAESADKILLITQEFLAELTTIASRTKSKLTPFIESHTKKVTHLVVDLLKKEESGHDMIFTKIEAILPSMMEGELDEKKVVTVTGFVDKLVDAEVAVEKRTQRRRVVEDYLYGVLSSTLHWKDYSVTSYCHILDVQLKILRRRNALGTLTSLANCFVSITAIPFTSIEEMTIFRKVFCKAANLLNAFTVHRLDVVSFRTHIDLQCFQFLVESLTMRADQKNKLTDSEIYDLIYCAHALERVCQSAKLGQKEFSRVSPYFVAILMRQFEMFTVYPAVKNPLMSGCYKLLDLCDDHGIAQVNSMLSVGSREIFKTVYDLYKKYYRYSGRV